MAWSSRSQLVIALGLWASMTMACGRLGYEQVSNTEVDAPATAQADGGPDDGATSANPRDASGTATDARDAASVLPDASSVPPDAASVPPDAPGAPPDAPSVPPDAAVMDPPPDAGPPPATETCDDVTSGSLSVWPFDDFANGTVRDVVGGRNGIAQGNLQSVAGAPGACGGALRWPSTGSAHVLVPHDPAFALASGAVDFWVLPGPAESTRGLVVRDLRGTEESGHFLVALLESNVLVLRIQANQAGTEDNNVVVLCSEAPLPRDTWSHVAVNFGPPRAELYINGRQNDGRDPKVNGGVIGDITCGTNSSLGIVGNEEPWIFGASNHRSLSGVSVDLPANAVTLGRIRLRAERLTF
ncbi:MAG: LamG domain-containing protein [Myxococcales bacterium]|nr:LamG domain-containing protein [Myxococcales bacterium]